MFLFDVYVYLHDSYLAPEASHKHSVISPLNLGILICLPCPILPRLGFTTPLWISRGPLGRFWATIYILCNLPRIPARWSILLKCMGRRSLSPQCQARPCEYLNGQIDEHKSTRVNADHHLLPRTAANEFFSRSIPDWQDIKNIMTRRGYCDEEPNN